MSSAAKKKAEHAKKVALKSKRNVYDDDERGGSAEPEQGGSESALSQKFNNTIREVLEEQDGTEYPMQTVHRNIKLKVSPIPSESEIARPKQKLPRVNRHDSGIERGYERLLRCFELLSMDWNKKQIHKFLFKGMSKLDTASVAEV
mmetsp:Transcript_34528/g.52826  ORF Transcript_34528/g.52826 Transcript_34528/m.52826 type:complete len:146 (-) Transcript_34528:56-493(-)